MISSETHSQSQIADSKWDHGLAIGYRLSAIGYRLSAIGYRLSAIGYWLLAIGYRLCVSLAIGYLSLRQQ
jgi:hypothetical protein